MLTSHARSSARADTSITVKTEDMLSGTFGSFDEARPARIGLAPLHRAEAAAVQWFTLDQPLGIVHPLAAWDEDDHTTVLWTPVCSAFDGGPSPQNEAFMREITLDKASGMATVRTPRGAAGLNTEFGRLHPGYVGRKARWGFTGIMDGGDARFGGVAKWDLAVGSGGLAKTVRFGEGCYGGEPIVVPKATRRPTQLPGEGEADHSDDAYVLTFVHRERSDTMHREGMSFLSVVDGGTMEQVCKLKLPRRVPYGLHGLWMGEEELRAHVARTRSASEPASEPAS
jgi:9-cis-epoxycarotenoid dioxygenase